MLIVESIKLNFIFRKGLDLNVDSLFTSLLGGSTDLLNFNPDKPPVKEDGGCASLGLDFFTMVPCDKPKKFMCEARKPVK